MSRVHFSGDFLGDTLVVKGTLSFEKGTTFSGVVNLNGSDVGGQLSIFGARFDDVLRVEGAKIRSSVVVTDSTFNGLVDMSSADIGGSVELVGDDINSVVNLSASSVKGALVVGFSESRQMVWGPKSSLLLMNTTVGSWQDLRKSAQEDLLNVWPTKGNLQLEGFTYSRVGGREADAPSALFSRPTSSFVGWLGLLPRYSPQPYQQLADTFRSYGAPNKAAEILRAGRERARAEADWVEWVGLTLLKITVGYGLGRGYFYSLGWIGLLTITGCVVLIRRSEIARKNGYVWSFWASLDEMLPFVKLDHEHDGAINQLDGIARSYFYFQKLVAYLLGTFIIAGIAGLTQG